MKITPSADTFLKSFIHKGVARLISEGYAKDETRIKLAEDNLVKFIERTAMEDRKMGFKYFREPTFNVVLKFLCPIWPFC
jgi:hypothetical protein